MSEPSSRSLEQAHEALMYDEGTFDSVVRNIARALDAARAEERQRCARIAEAATDTSGDAFAFRRIASAIRTKEAFRRLAAAMRAKERKDEPLF